MFQIDLRKLRITSHIIEALPFFIYSGVGSLDHTDDDASKSGYENPNYKRRNDMVQFVMNLPDYNAYAKPDVVITTPHILEGSYDFISYMKRLIFTFHGLTHH